jgi:hypothetical protein
MIGGKRVKAGLHIGEVLPEQSRHILVEAVAVRHGSCGVSPGALAATLFLPNPLCKAADSSGMGRIPGEPGQLSGMIRSACGEAGKGTGHSSLRVGGGKCDLMALDPQVGHSGAQFIRVSQQCLMALTLPSEWRASGEAPSGSPVAVEVSVGQAQAAAGLSGWG